MTAESADTDEITARTEQLNELAALRTALDADYEVIELLGRGGMGAVYLARDKGLHREVAIKVLPPILAADAEFVERFQREARTAAQLEHPNIVPIYRVGRSGNAIYFVMKLLRGQSLGAVLKARGKLEAPEIRRILLETAAALNYAGRRNVVHRDIKPDNILLDSEGRCVITDFGIAKTAGGPKTAAGTSMGTPRYMSPEQAQGTPLDGRSDIYSLGVVAYQCLTGVTPFDADDPFAVLFKHINEPIPIPTLQSDEERELYSIIARMLAKDREDRFQHADEIIATLGGDVPTMSLADDSGPRKLALTPTQIMSSPPELAAWMLLRDWRVLTGVAALGLVVAGTMWTRKGPPTVADSVRNPAAAVTSLAGAPAAASPAPAPLLAAPVVVKPKPVPFSRCPELDSASATKALTVLVDSVKAQKEGTKLPLSYDVCGLPAGAAFTTEVTLTKTDQSRLGRVFGRKVEPVTSSYPGVADSPRTRRKRSIDLKGLPPGSYTVSVKVTDAKERTRDKTRAFQVTEKK